MATKRKKKVVKKSKREAKAKTAPDRSGLKVEYVPLRKLKPWKNNPRHNDAAAERLAGLLGEHGFINPIIATRDGIIRAGDTRYKAAKLRGMKTVPVIYVDFGSVAEAEMFSVADNRSAEWAEWDEDKLADLLGERKHVSIEALAKLSGFQQAEIEGLRQGWNVGEQQKAGAKSADEKQMKCPKCGFEWEE